MVYMPGSYPGDSRVRFPVSATISRATMSKENTQEVYVCALHGEVSSEPPTNKWPTNCVENAVLCFEGSLQKDEHGNVVLAYAVSEPCMRND